MPLQNLYIFEQGLTPLPFEQCSKKLQDYKGGRPLTAGLAFFHPKATKSSFSGEVTLSPIYFKANELFSQIYSPKL